VPQHQEQFYLQVLHQLEALQDNGAFFANPVAATTPNL